MRQRGRFQLSPSKATKNETKRPKQIDTSNRLYAQSISTASLPFGSFGGNTTSEDVESRTMPRLIFKSPMKKSVEREALEYIPVVQMEAPIVLREAATAEVVDDDESGNDEQFNLTKEELRKTYKQLIARYEAAAEQFNRLEKKRVKMIAQNEALRQQVRDLNAEQSIVQAEFERLGLGEQD